MKCISFKSLSGLFLAGVFLAGTVAAEAQFTGVTDVTMWGSRRGFFRGIPGDSFAPNGQSGSTWDTKKGRGAGQWAYPFNYATLCCFTPKYDDADLWGAMAEYSAGQMQDNAAGKGVIVLQNTNGEKFVSWTGPNVPSSDTLPLIYDIENSRYSYDAAVNAALGPAEQFQFGSGSSIGAPYLGRETVTPSYVGDSNLGPGGVGENTTNWYPGALSKLDAGVAAHQTDCYEINNYDWSIYAPVQNEAEKLSVCQWTHKNDLVVTRINRGWSHQDLDDGILWDIEIENQGSATMNGVHIGFMNTLYTSVFGCKWWNANVGAIMQYRDPGCYDDWFKFTEAPNYVAAGGDADLVGKIIHYVYDGDDKTVLFHDDTGDPNDNSIRSPYMFRGFNMGNIPDGVLQSPAFVGTGWLAFQNTGASHTFNEYDKAQGYNDPVGFSGALGKYWPVIKRGVADEPFEAKGWTAAQQYDGLLGATNDDPTTDIQEQFQSTLIGPYNLDPGDKAKVVFFMFGAHGGMFEFGPEGSGYSKDVMRWAFDNAGAFGTDVALRKQKFIGDGHKGVGMVYDHFAFAYANDYQIPNTPPDIERSFAFSPEAQNVISWPSAEDVNPDYGGTSDITAYRIYTSDFDDSGGWRPVGEVPATGASSYTFIDPESVAGFGYLYTVRAVASAKTTWSEGNATLADLPARMASHVTGGMMGGFAAVEQTLWQPKYPKAAPATAFENLDEVPRVVPNPFSLSRDKTESNYQSGLNIRFTGVPAKSTIRIYSVSGDLMRVIHHDDPNAGEAVWTQNDRFSSATVGTGVYYFVVENASGKTQKGTFVVLR